MDIRKSKREVSSPAKPIPSKRYAADTAVNARPQKSVESKFTLKKIIFIIIATLVSFLIVLLLIRVAYAGRIYQGVWGNGVYIGGLTKKQAVEQLDKQTGSYLNGHQIVIAAGESKWTVKTEDIDAGYDNDKLVDDVYSLGRNGSIYHRLSEQLTLFLGLYQRDNYAVNFDPVKLDHYVINIAETVNSPVRNASYNFSDSTVAIAPEKTGSRLDLNNLNQALTEHLGGQKDTPVTLSPKDIKPLVSAAALINGKQKINSYASDNVILSYAGSSWQIDREQILEWIKVVAISSDVFQTDKLENYYKLSEPTISYEPDKKMIGLYLDDIARKINREAQDAKLTINDGRASVFVRSQDGRKLNIEASTDAIVAAITGQTGRAVALNVDVKKAAVSDDNIDQLGIKELISEGATTFPGSTADRNTNIRIGAARYNGVLLKPGQEFSFGDYLGPIGPEQGYKQSKVILEGRLENEYGGGLCQVSTTVFRAALLAGLPITERHNHAFAVSYYTAPYGVPGVDATIYYPGVDFRFRNDTGAYILIQTEMIGTSLKFRFFGTKKKEGVIRGPNFISGNSDPNQPSKTVFYRDVVVDGKVVKTNTFTTSYKSAKDYPPVH